MDESLPGLREMRMFVAVYEKRSFTAAAAREFATQSGVSQHVKQIEESLGVQLFDRQKTGEPIELDKLAGLKLLAPNSREHAQWVGSQLDVQSRPGARYQLDAVLATLDLIRQSEWMAILPGLLFVHDISADPSERDFRLNPFSGSGLTLELLLVRPPEPTPSPLTKAAIRAIQQVTQKHILLLRTFTSDNEPAVGQPRAQIGR